jgi:hypothetical protein
MQRDLFHTGRHIRPGTGLNAERPQRDRLTRRVADQHADSTASTRGRPGCQATLLTGECGRVEVVGGRQGSSGDSPPAM